MVNNCLQRTVKFPVRERSTEIKGYLSLIALAILAGCSTPPSDLSGRRLSLADAGPPPADQKVVVAAVLRHRLKDFDSAKIEYPTRPRPAVFANTAFNNGGAGWEICPLVNAKNSFGAYTGYRPVFIFWNSGQVLDFNADEMSEFWCRDKNDARIEVGPRLD